MKTTLRFEHVSKRYELGLTRTSLPTLVSQWVRKSLKPGHGKAITLNGKHIWAVRDVSFALEEGQSLALIGPNGAGKTTILKLLAKITKPTEGNIEINGQLSALIELGAGFHPDLTGRENIYLNGAILGLSQKYVAGHFDEIVAFSELERFIDTPLKRYSSGMKVRLGFAVAASIEPDILLVDEVLSVGDSSFRQKCMNRIQELLDRGTSIIFVSHNLWLVQTVCTNAIYLDEGQIRYIGQTSEAINLYDRNLSERRAEKFSQVGKGDDDRTFDVEITKIEVLGRNGQESDDLPNDQPADLRIHYLSYKEVGDVTMVVRIIRSDGLTCCMMRNSLDKVQIHLGPGSGVVSVTVDPLQLRGGTYFVQAMIRDGSDARSIVTNNSEWFYVSGSTLAFNEMNGVFEPNRYWRHQTEQREVPRSRMKK
jgi:lipopolysaccharide transport system ATP-binding protein